MASRRLSLHRLPVRFRLTRRRSLLLAVVVALAAGVGPVIWVHVYSRARLTTVQQVPDAPVALVLGARVYPDGTPSPFLARRLDIAADLYAAGTVRVVLVTGDNSSVTYDEVGAMTRYLVDRGVPRGKIAADHAGFDTYDSCVRARRIFDVQRAIVVSQRYHLPRAVAICRAVGIEAYGVGDDSARYDPDRTTRGTLRESVADIKAVGQLILRPDPHFLGPKETGVTEALRS